MENEYVGEIDKLLIEASLSDDARRMQAIMEEAHAILERNNWNGAAKVLVETSDDTYGCFGFCVITNPAQLLSAASDGLQVYTAAKIFADT